jgi:hypothetical protein
VLSHVGRGPSISQIATTLVINRATVMTHIKRVLLKLDLRDRAQAVVFAYETGLVQPSSTWCTTRREVSPLASFTGRLRRTIPGRDRRSCSGAQAVV